MNASLAGSWDVEVVEAVAKARSQSLSKPDIEIKIRHRSLALTSSLVRHNGAKYFLKLHCHPKFFWSASFDLPIDVWNLDLNYQSLFSPKNNSQIKPVKFETFKLRHAFRLKEVRKLIQLWFLATFFQFKTETVFRLSYHFSSKKSQTSQLISSYQ